MSNSREFYDEYEAYPSKNILESLVADLSHPEAIGELIDNSIDGARRNDIDTLDVDITYSKETRGPHSDRLIIEDTGGGVNKNQLENLIKLADNIDDREENKIGAFGIGLLRSVCKLGGEVKIETRKNNGESFLLEIPENWWDDSEWTVKVYTTKNPIKAGRTKITIYDLDFDFRESLEEVENYLSSVYNRYLENKQEINLNIDINGKSITSNEEIAWSYSPFGFHPRKYKNVPLNPNDKKEDRVYATVTVGLLRKGSSSKSGTDIYCQGRKIVSRSSSRDGYFGDEEDYLGDFTREARFRMIVEFNAEQNTQILPWESNKSDINLSSPIFRKGYKLVEKVAQTFYDARYNIKKPLIQPYDSENPNSYNNGEIVIVEQEDYGRLEHFSEKHRFMKDDLDKITSLQDEAVNQAQFGVIYYEVLNDVLNQEKGDFEGQKEGFKKYIKENLNERILTKYMTTVNDFPFDMESSDNYEEEIVSIARRHANVKKYDVDGLSQWEIPLYESVIETELPESISLESLKQKESEKEREKDGSEGTNNSSEESTGDDGKGNKDNDGKDSGKKDRKTNKGTGNKKDEKENGDSNEKEFQSTKRERQLTVSISELKYKDLIESLGLSPGNANKDEVEDELSEFIETMVDLKNH